MRYFITIALALIMISGLISCRSVPVNSTLNTQTPPLAATPVQTQDYADVRLTGTQWTVASINGIPYSEDDDITLILADTGYINGMNLCNNYAGKYTMHENNTITFSDMVTTALLCPSGNDIAESYLSLFRNTITYRVSGNHLYFTDNNGNEIVVFKSP